MKIQGQENKFVAIAGEFKLTKSFEEIKENTLKEDASSKVTISKEGMEQLKKGMEQVKTGIVSAAKKELGNTGVMLTDYRTMISGRLPSHFEELKTEEGKTTRVYQTVNEKAERLLKAYAEAYDEIERGHDGGNREAFIADEKSPSGYKKLTKQEEIAELDKAYKELSTEFEHNNSEKIISALSDYAEKITEISGGRVKIATVVGDDLKNRTAEVEKLPADMSKKLLNAAMNFKVQYGLKKGGQIDLLNILSKINIFGVK